MTVHEIFVPITYTWSSINSTTWKISRFFEILSGIVLNSLDPDQARQNVGPTVNLVLVRTVKNNYFSLCTN